MSRYRRTEECLICVNQVQLHNYSSSINTINLCWGYPYWLQFIPGATAVYVIDVVRLGTFVQQYIRNVSSFDSQSPSCTTLNDLLPANEYSVSIRVTVEGSINFSDPSSFIISTLIGLSNEIGNPTWIILGASSIFMCMCIVVCASPLIVMSYFLIFARRRAFEAMASYVPPTHEAIQINHGPPLDMYKYCPSPTGEYFDHDYEIPREENTISLQEISHADIVSGRDRQDSFAASGPKNQEINLIISLRTATQCNEIEDVPTLKYTTPSNSGWKKE